MSFFRPAASHSVSLCTCPPDCRTNEQTAWLAKAVRAMSARPLRVWHLPSKRSPEMPAVPRLVCGLSAQLLFCLSGRQPLVCLGAAGCGLLTAATSAFASAGVRGRHSPRLQSVSGRCTMRFRQVHKAFQAGAQATGAVVRRWRESDAERHSPRLEIAGRQMYRLQSPRLEERRLEGVWSPMQNDTRRGWKWCMESDAE